MTKITSDSAADEPAEVLAFYLRQYPSVEIMYDGRKLDPSVLEAKAAYYRLDPIDTPTGAIEDAVLTVIEWKTSTSRSLAGESV